MDVDGAVVFVNVGLGSLYILYFSLPAVLEESHWQSGCSTGSVPSKSYNVRNTELFGAHGTH